jgi:hypothetical protein
MSLGIVWRIYVGFVSDLGDHETLIVDIKSRASHGKKTADLEGEYMGLVAHEEVAKFSHNNQDLGRLTLQC